MEYLSIQEIIFAIDGKLIIKSENNGYNDICTDTRKVSNGNIFIALKGENFNGNEYVLEAIQKGAALCIIDEIKFKEDDVNNQVSIILVSDTKKALLKLSGYYRSKLRAKVIAITGSTGKTSTKDLVSAALSSKYKVYKTQGNFNNEIGLPLTIFKLDNSIDVAILEMGMSNLGEIHNMAEAARPDIALITNIGLSHIENLKTKENILKAKLEICDFFNDKSTLILNGENDMLNSIDISKFEVLKVGIGYGEFLRALNIKLNENSVEFDIMSNKLDNLSSEIKTYRFSVDIPGTHTVLNALLAIATGIKLNMSYEELQKGLNNLETTAMRLDIIKKEKFTIINDCYNASPDSMKAAIDVLCNLKVKRKIVLLGTMKELGDESYNAHKEVGAYALEKAVDLVITLGEYSNAFKEGVEKTNYISSTIFKTFDTYDNTINYLKNNLKEGDAILIKASRTMKFETIVNELLI